MLSHAIYPRLNRKDRKDPGLERVTALPASVRPGPNLTGGRNPTTLANRGSLRTLRFVHRGGGNTNSLS